MMNAIRLRFLFALFGSLFVIGRCDIFASIAHLQEAVFGAKARNGELKELLKGYITDQLERMDRAERLIQKLHDLSGDEIKDPTFKITHPLNAYRFIRNHSEIFNSTLDKAVTEISSFENDTHSLYKANVSRITESQVNITDLNGTVTAFLRLQTTYNISTKEFADGSYIGEPESKLTDGSLKKTESKAECAFMRILLYSQPAWSPVFCQLILLADECRDVSAILCLKGFHSIGLRWLREAKLRKHLEVRDGASIDGVMRLVARSALKGGNYFAALMAIDDKTETKHVDRRNWALARRIVASLKQFRKTAKPEEVERKKHLATDIRTGDPKYNRLCSGQTDESNRTLSDKLLSCRYDDNGNPYLILQPVKYEQLSSKPYLVVYHDVFSDKDINTMKGATKHKLRRSGAGDGRKTQPSEGRISASTSVRFSIETSKLIDKVKAITSFKAGGEFLQIANYGVGGYYTRHYDAFPGYENNRIATFMVYLSDVEMGGATIFPNIELSIFPKKGTAVFWGNMYRNAVKRDLRTRHSACPVLKGDKWVGTFWIREAGHEFILPCTLNEHD